MSRYEPVGFIEADGRRVAIGAETMDALVNVADHLGMEGTDYLRVLALLAESDSPIGQMVRGEISERAAHGVIREKIAELVDLAVETRYGDGMGGGLVEDVARALRERLPQTPQAPGTSKRRPIGAGLRTLVMERDEYRCVHCADHEDLQIDHVTPISRGGTNDEANLQTLCGPCNRSKGARTMDEWLASMERQS